MTKGLREWKLRDLVFWVAVWLIWLLTILPPARYLYLGVSILVLFVALADRRIRVGEEAAPFLLICIAGVVFSPLASAEGARDVFLILAGVSASVLLTHPRIDIGKIVFWYVTAVLIHVALFRDVGNFRFDFAASQSTLEGSFAFMFGLLAVFSMIGRRWWCFVVCVFFAFLTLKRIAVLAIALVFLVWITKRQFGEWLLRPIVMVPANLAAVFLLLMYGSGALDSLIVLSTGMDANQLGMGRKALLSMPSREIFGSPESFLFFGTGPGGGYDLTSQTLRYAIGKVNLHSDLVKILYEYGFVVFCLFFGLAYRAKSYAVRLAFLYVNILLLTDNVLIYYFLIATYVIVSRAFSAGDSSGDISSAVSDGRLA